MTASIRTVLLIAALWCSSGTVSRAQVTRDPFDSLYVVDYSHLITGRAYLSTKDNAFSLRGSNGGKDLVYKPNNRYNIGIGASYRSLTLNIGLPMPWVNNNDDVFGRTRYFDAQANIHTKRTATNLFLQIFKGYYLRSYSLEETNWPALAQRPYRPDIRQFNMGSSLLRVVNNDRFSYRASFNQDAWQKRSQGSLLYGGYATYFGVRADSSIVPTALDDRFIPSTRITRADLFDAGLMGGYVHTLVFREHWFATLSGVLGAGLSLQGTTYENASGALVNSSLGAGPAWRAQLRSGVGYNSQVYYVGFSYNIERSGQFLDEQQRLAWNVSNIRFNFVRRFNGRIGFMDRGIRWFRKKAPEPLKEMLPDE